MAKFNAPNIQWVRVHDKKIRVKRKLAGLEAKHKAGVKRVSGVRTGKNIRKTAHKVRMNDKEKAVRQLLLKDTPPQQHRHRDGRQGGLQVGGRHPEVSAEEGQEAGGRGHARMIAGRSPGSVGGVGEVGAMVLRRP
ncbi:MAG: hypothetical protein WDW36_004686 [Sanguina aurantia]